MDIVNFDGLITNGRIINPSDINSDEDYFILGHFDNRRKEFKATDYPIFAIKASDVLNPTPFNNPFDFYLDGNAPAGGDGSVARPFNLFSVAVAHINTLPQAQYTLKVMPYSYTEVAPVIDLPNVSSLNIIGLVANSCGFNFNVRFIASLSNTAPVALYDNIAFNGFELDLSVVNFASITFTASKVDLVRVDANPNTIVTLFGAMFTSTISGRVLWSGGVMFGDINVEPNGELFCDGVLQIGGQFKLRGTAQLKTLSMINPQPNGVDGVQIGLDIPIWRTDAASDETFTGTVNKIIY